MKYCFAEVLTIYTPEIHPNFHNFSHCNDLVYFHNNEKKPRFCYWCCLWFRFKTFFNQFIKKYLNNNSENFLKSVEYSYWKCINFGEDEILKKNNLIDLFFKLVFELSFKKRPNKKQILLSHFLWYLNNYRLCKCQPFRVSGFCHNSQGCSTCKKYGL